MSETDEGRISETDVVVVGAGFAGLYAIYRFRELGFSVRAFEAGDGVGGTWYWNRYPGARCDVQSFDYSYSFSRELELEWTWTERYPGQPELLRYLNHVADRFGLRSHITLGTRVSRAVYDEDARRWILSTDTGEVVRAHFCVMATGMLSCSRIPSFEGLETYQGEVLHTGQWPEAGVDFGGQRVGVIGTGSSGIQAIPKIAENASHLTVFQRTPHFSIPAWNAPIDPVTSEKVKQNYPARRAESRMTHIGQIQHINAARAASVSVEERESEYERRWADGGASFMGAFGDLLLDETANETAAEFVRAKIRQIVHNSQVAELLSPREYPIGTKRICVDTGYYATYNRPNVTLVDVKSAPIVAFTETCLVTTEREYELDAVVFATGFDAMTGALAAIDIRGRDDADLRGKWAAGPRLYLGLATSGFPNLFIVTGPGSPSVLSNMVNSIEQHVEWITELVSYMRENHIDSVEPDLAAEDEWVEHVNGLARKTLYHRANSWFLGANVPGKPRVFMPYVGGVGRYRIRCEEEARGGYPGLRMQPARSVVDVDAAAG